LCAFQIREKKMDHSQVMTLLTVVMVLAVALVIIGFVRKKK